MPFFFVLVAIASILFSWQEAYELYVLQCKEDEGQDEAVDYDSGNDGEINDDD